MARVAAVGVAAPGQEQSFATDRCSAWLDGLGLPEFAGVIRLGNMIKSGFRLSVLSIAAAFSACARAPEVIVLSHTTSPNGTYDAEVREVVYGPHFGGESPAIEVWIARASQSERVLQIPEDGSEVFPLWTGAARLEIHLKGNPATRSFKEASLGASIELKGN